MSASSARRRTCRRASPARSRSTSTRAITRSTARERPPRRTRSRSPAPRRPTGNTDTHALLVQGTADYAKYVNTQVDQLLVGAQPLDATLKGTDLTAAQNAYKKSRVYYERIEPVAESFTTGNDDLDGDIDARADDVPAEQLDRLPPHREGLFQNSLTGLATFGDGLVSQLAEAADPHRRSDLPAGRTRQRRGRAARRGRQDQDHRRGGALLAHRPAGLLRQRRGRRAGVRRPAARLDQDRPGAGDRGIDRLRRARRRPASTAAAPTRPASSCTAR